MLSGITQPAEGRLAVRRRHDLAGAVRPRLPEPAEPLHVRQHAGRRDGGQHAALNAALAGFPDAKLQTKSQFINNQLQGLTTLLNLLYVLLSLSIVVSLFGIVNTLVLTVFERTRELGMLRAVGMSRRQVRRMIRHESVITALLGAAFGIPLGIVLAALIGATIDFGTFTIPVGTLIVFVIAAVHRRPDRGDLARRGAPAGSTCWRRCSTSSDSPGGRSRYSPRACRATAGV